MGGGGNEKFLVAWGRANTGIPVSSECEFQRPGQHTNLRDLSIQLFSLLKKVSSPESRAFSQMMLMVFLFSQVKTKF